MGKYVKADLLADQVVAQLKAMQAAAQDTTPAFAAIGRVISNRIRLGFKAGRSPWGVPWAPLTSRVGQPLRNTGLLQRSITSKPSKDSVEVGTNRTGAPTQHFGATILPKKGKYLVFQIGGRKVFAKKVTIPARPFMPITPGGQVDLPEAWSKGVLQALAKHLGVGVPA